MRACVRRACVRACVRAHVCVCVCVRECVPACVSACVSELSLCCFYFFGLFGVCGGRWRRVVVFVLFCFSSKVLQTLCPATPRIVNNNRAKTKLLLVLPMYHTTHW